MRAFIVRHKKILSILFGLILYSTVVVYATPPDSPYTSGETLDPTCLPGSDNCSVSTTIYTDSTLSGSGTIDDPFSVVGSTDAVPVLSVGAATTAVLPGTPTYSNGTSGVGATLTEGTNGAIATIDGVTLAVSTRVLVKDQVDDTQNGVYAVTDLGSVSTPYILTRTTDSDESSELTDQIASPSAGTANKGKLFAQGTADPVIGSDSITYSRTTALYVSQKSTGTQVAGQIPFWTSKTKQLSKGSSSLFWDSTNSRLGVGTATPSAALHVTQGVTASAGVGSGALFAQTITANANNDVLRGLAITSTFAHAGHTGVSDIALGVYAPTATSATFRLGKDNDFKTDFIVDPTNGNLNIQAANNLVSINGTSGSLEAGYLGLGIHGASGAFLSIKKNLPNVAQINFESSTGVDDTSPANGDLWWNGTNLYFYNGTVNKDLLGGWGITGNAGTTAGTNYIGTSDAVDVVFKRSNFEYFRLSAANTYFSVPVWNNSTLRQDDAASFGFAGAPVANQSITVSGFNNGAIVSNTAMSASLGLTANRFAFTNFGNTTATGSITAVGAYAGNNVDGGNETADLYRTYAAYITNKSGSATPVTNAVGYDFNIENGISAGTQTFTTVYGYRTTPISAYHAGGILTTGGKYYGFYSDATAAASIAGGTGYGFYQKANADNSIYNVFEGKTSVGTTANPTYTLQVGNSSVSGIVARFENSNGTCDINPTTIALSCSSDRNLKKNITPIADGILDKVLSLQAITYNWNAESDTDPTHSGFIAQDIQQVFPDLVTEDANTHLLSLNYIGLIPYTIKALQEMNLKIAVLPVETDQTFTDRLANFLKGIAEQGSAIIDHVHTKELCVSDATGDVCVTAQQLRNLLQPNQSTITDTTTDDTAAGDTTGTTGDTNTTDTTTDGTTDQTTDAGTSTDTTTEPAPETTAPAEVAPPSDQNTDAATSTTDTTTQ